MIDLKLGKKPAAPRPKDFKWEDFASAITLTLPSHPRDFGHGLLYTDWGMLGNGPDGSVAPGFSGAGDCVCAGACHEVRMINKIVSGNEVPFSGKEAIKMYSDVTGYVVGDDATDNGTDMGQASEYRRLTGVEDAAGVRHKIAAWIRLKPQDWQQLIEATYIFMATGIGFVFPSSAWPQFNSNEPWDYDPHANNSIEGGHYVPRVGSKRVVSWGRSVQMTQSFYEHFNDETMVYVTEEELRKSGKDVHGFDLEKLNFYLGALRS